MTVVSHQYSDFFVVIAPILDVLFYILELWIYLCKSRAAKMVSYPDNKMFRED